MKKILFLCLFLTACSTTQPSESISNGVKNDLNTLSKEIKSVSSVVLPECKTDTLVGRLNEISLKVKNISSQVENISLACKTEKQVLEQSVTIRNIWIGILGAAIAVLLYFMFKINKL